MKPISNGRRHRPGFPLASCTPRSSHRALGREQVPVLADGARIARYQKQGFWYNDAPCDFNYTDAAAPTESVDLLLSPSEFGGLQNAIKTYRHLVGPDTLVISVLNGSPARGSWEIPLVRSMGLVRGGADGRQGGGQPRRLQPDWGTGGGRPRREDTSRLQQLTAF